MNSEQTSLRNEYYERQKARYGREDWAKDSTKRIAYFVKLDNGDIVGIEKPKLKTRFCFGYGYCGVSTDEDYRNAEACATYARTKQQYFIEENLKQLDYNLDDETKALKLADGIARVVEKAHYYYNAKDLQPLTEHDKQNIADGYIAPFATYAKHASKPTNWQTDGTKITRQTVHIFLTEQQAERRRQNRRKPL